MAAAQVSIRVLVECADEKHSKDNHDMWSELGLILFGCRVPQVVRLIVEYFRLRWQLAAVPKSWPQEVVPMESIPLFRNMFDGVVWEETDYAMFSCLGYDLSKACPYLTRPLVAQCPLPPNPPVTVHELSEGAQTFISETTLYAPLLRWFSLEQVDDSGYWDQVARTEYLGPDREADYTFEDEYMPHTFRTFLNALYRYKQHNAIDHLRIVFWFESILPESIPQSSAFYV